MRPFKNKALLLVEDDPMIQALQVNSLQKYGYQIIVASSGQEAIDTIEKSSHIDLILMDIDLGEGYLDGTETAQIILFNHDIPIVFLSSHTEPEIVEKTEKITSYGYVVKSSHIAVLDASIKMAFKLFEAHQKLLESEEKFKQVYDNTLDNIFILEITDDRRYRVIGLNPAEEALVSRYGDMQNKFLDDCIPADVYMRVKKNYERCLLERKIISYEEVVHGHDFYTQLIPVKNKKGDIYRIIGIARNISELSKVTKN
ncbi:MAG TPA: response regulator [Leptospiraceae bacterium]|nr:response regulator [Leptospiraceae bacterium]HRG76551.1 response regulator [Leptospiraceae bacterium]